MSQSIITHAFEAYKAEQEYLQQPVALDEFVLAFVPGQDPTDPIDPNEGLPPVEQIVYTAPVTQDGYVNPNAVAYSLIMDTRVGDFEFNWVGLRNKASGVIAAITHVPAIQKYKSIVGVQNGNSVTRSILMSYQNAKSLTGINVDASTWQIDFTARLYGIEENERLANLDVFGHGAFLGDGFKISKSGETYTAINGRAYVGGLRCHLDVGTEVLGVLPNRFIYLDASWQGQLTSQNQTVFDIVVSDSELSDYVGEDGYHHYVTKVAETDDWGNPIDHRYIEGFAQYYQKHELDDFLNQKVDKSAITDDTNSTSSSQVASGKAVGDVKRALDGHKVEDNPHPQYWHNDEVATKSEAIAGTTHSKILTALRGMEMLKSRISSSLSGTRTDYAASESALKAAYDLAASKMTQAIADGRYLLKTATAAAASKLATARTIALSGDASGSTSFDGSSNVTISVSVNNDSHHHSASTLPSASTSAKGIVQLSSATNSTSSVLAATVGALKVVMDKAVSAYNLANGKMTSFVLEDGDGTEVSVTNSKEIKFVEGGNIDINWTDTSNGSDGDPFDLTFSVPNASTSARGAVQLSTATNSTSTTLAATPSAVKAAYDRASSGVGSASKASTGWAKLGSGIIIQWGIVDDAVGRVMFPTAFPVACATVVMSYKDVTYGSAASPMYASVKSFTTTSFTKQTSVTAIGGSRVWIAIGY